MTKKQEYLNKHPFSIWEGTNDKKWYTYLPNTSYQRKKKLIKRTSKEAIEKIVIDYWKEQEKLAMIHTFKDVYFLWRETHDELVSENTIAKYDTDYKRFFEGHSFENKPIKQISDDDIKIFMCKAIKRLKLQKEPSRKLFGYINNTILTARKKEFISTNPLEFISSSDFYTYCYDVYKPPESQILSATNMQKLQERFALDHKLKPDYMPTYAVELASLTGMRVGELSAIRWDRITDDYIIIDSSEKTNRQKNEFYIDKTKNGRIRRFPIDEEIRKLLGTIKNIQEQYGFSSEWVFANKNGRIHSKTITACMQTKCRQLGIPQNGIYTLRKTFNSNLRCNGVSPVVASQLLGHSPETNNKYYTFDNTDLSQKNVYVSVVNAKTKKGNTR